MSTTPVDLNTCVKGQKLRSVHGLILTYVGKNPVRSPFSHIVQYPPDSSGYPQGRGTRTDDGRVAINKPLATDHDIVEILPLE